MLLARTEEVNYHLGAIMRSNPPSTVHGDHASNLSAVKFDGLSSMDDTKPRSRNRCSSTRCHTISCSRGKADKTSGVVTGMCFHDSGGTDFTRQQVARYNTCMHLVIVRTPGREVEQADRSLWAPVFANSRRYG